MKTKDYSIFKFSKANRPLSEQNVLKIMRSFQEFGFMEGRDVIIDNDNVVVDGQHRIEACKRLGIEVNYVVSNGNAIAKTIALNNCQKQWTIEDYINSYAAQGFDFYRRLINFNQKYNLGFSTSLDVFIQNPMHVSQKIKQGSNFTVNTQSDDIAEFILSCNKVPFFRSKYFARSIVYLFKKANKKQLEYIKLNILSVPQQPNTQQYLTVYENMLNHKKRGNNRISL